MKRPPQKYYDDWRERHIKNAGTKGMNKPKFDVFIEGFDYPWQFAEYYGITKNAYEDWRLRGKILFVRHKVKSKTRRGWSRKRAIVNTYEIYNWLHTRGHININDVKNNGIKRQMGETGDWILNLCRLSNKMKEKLSDEMLESVVDLINEHGNKRDKKIAEGFKPTPPHEQITNNNEGPDPQGLCRTEEQDVGFQSRLPTIL